MQTGANSQRDFRQPRLSRNRSGIAAHLAAAAAVIVLALSSALLAAQLPDENPFPPDSKAPAPPPMPARMGVTTPPKPSPSTPAAAPAPQAALPEQPRPDWPVNDKPIPPKITFDSHGLTIDANNSSLDEIMKEVAAATGAKLDGHVGEDRIYGTYGPGPTRDVITELLDGTSYNVLMAGDQGQGTPREIVLSNRPTGPAPANNGRNNADEEVEYEQPQPVPENPGLRGPFPPQGAPPEQNQQLMEERRQEMEQRQEQIREQQMEQQQQQQEQQQPPQPPQ